MDFASIFDRCAEAPKCVSHWFLQGFVDVGCFAHGAFAAWKNFEKTVVSSSKIEVRGVPGALRGAGLSAKTASSRANVVSANEATSSEKARPEPPKIARGPGDSESALPNLRMDAFTDDADDVVVFLATLLMLLVPMGPW